MQVTTQKLGSAQVVTIGDRRIDAASAIEFKDQMRMVQSRGAPRIVLNLENVDFVDSSGLGAIVAVMKQMKDGQRLDLASLQPAVNKVFHLTRMDTVFRIFPSAEAAVDGKLTLQ